LSATECVSENYQYVIHDLHTKLEHATPFAYCLISLRTKAMLLEHNRIRVHAQRGASAYQNPRLLNHLPVATPLTCRA